MTSTGNQFITANPRPSDLEPNALFTWPRAPTVPGVCPANPGCRGDEQCSQMFDMTHNVLNYMHKKFGCIMKHSIGSSNTQNLPAVRTLLSSKMASRADEVSENGDLESELTRTILNLEEIDTNLYRYVSVRMFYCCIVCVCILV